MELSTHDRRNRHTLFCGQWSLSSTDVYSCLRPYFCSISIPSTKPHGSILSLQSFFVVITSSIMDLAPRTHGYYNLNGILPMQYCWVASNIASATHQNPQYKPHEDDVVGFSFSGQLDRYPYKINYSAVAISCLMFHRDRLLVCAYRPVPGDSRRIKLRNDLWRTELGKAVSADNPSKCFVPQYVTSRIYPPDYGVPADTRINMRARSTIGQMLTAWAERITGEEGRTRVRNPGVIYKTVADDGSAYSNPDLPNSRRSSADMTVLAMIAGIFECTARPQDRAPKDPRQTQDWVHLEDVPFLPFQPGNRVQAVWLSEEEVAAENWVSPTVRELALIAFRVRKYDDIRKYGYEVGFMT